MHIELDLPDWVEERNIFILAGFELVAIKKWQQEWQVKTSRCNMCGKCCYFKGEPCEHLEDYGDGKWICGLRMARPVSCVVSPGADRYEGCTELFEAVND